MGGEFSHVCAIWHAVDASAMTSPMRGWGEITGRIAAVVLAGCVGALAALWTWTAPGDPALYPARPGDVGVPIHILDNGFHTDLAVPRAALEAGGGPLGEASRSLASGDWILIGWGDATFYVDQRPISSRLLDGGRAFFLPGNASVVMLDPRTQAQLDAFARPNRRSVRLSTAGFARLRKALEGSLALTDGRARIAAARPGDDARFFASRETFWIGQLCNHWTARLLNAAGLPVRPLRAVTSAEVMKTMETAQQAAQTP